MSTPDKPKWPRAQALAVAAEIIAALAPSCIKIETAGSLRRGREMVGDVEILFIPRFEERAAGMFDTALFNLAEWEIGCLLGRGLLSKRPNVNGQFAFGEKNKLALHRSGVPVDLFTATEENWYNYLVCRTGPAESNLAICNAAIAKGWKWTPYGAGFYRIGHTEAMRSERAVFEFVGLPFNPPEKR